MLHIHRRCRRWESLERLEASGSYIRLFAGDLRPPEWPAIKIEICTQQQQERKTVQQVLLVGDEALLRNKENMVRL